MTERICIFMPNKVYDTRSVNLYLLYGGATVEQLTEEDVSLLQADPNFCEEDTLSRLCERHTEEELSRGDWTVFPDEPSVCLAHISSCIRENLEQTLASLAFRLAYEKRTLFAEAAREVCRLQRENGLRYYNRREADYPICWRPGTDNSLIEAIYVKKARRKHTRHTA